MFQSFIFKFKNFKAGFLRVQLIIEITINVYIKNNIQIKHLF